MARDTYKGLPGKLTEYATATTKILHIYADGDNGDDANEGFSPTDPKKTLEEAFKLVPDILKHSVVVHAWGTFTNSGNMYFPRPYISQPGAAFIFDGSVDADGNWLVEDDNSGNYYTISAGSSDTIFNVSGVSWTTDKKQGKLIEFLDGTHKGKTVGVYFNSSNTITLCYKLVGTSLGTTTKFRFVKPQAKITGGNNVFINSGVRYEYNQATYYVQNLRVSSYSIVIEDGAIFVTNLFSESTRSYAIQSLPNSGFFVRAMQEYLNADGSHSHEAYLGFGVVVSGGLILNNLMRQYLPRNIVGGDVTIFGNSYSNSWYLFSSVIGGTLTFESFNASLVSLSSSYGFSTPIGKGIVIKNSKIGALSSGSSDAVTNNSAGHAIEVMDSTVVLKDIAGTASAGKFGVYAHDNSTVLLASSLAVSGTGGDVTIDGTTAATTWATVWGGTPTIETTNDLVVIKKKG